ncbi:hypothetical protein P700755_003262 [Psychroflexus torquis ATCC 700755]|uniref:Uncharacterized protein n=1 Tax=Psychroflexus torquis (strain ATCC 700755 / CIP 106069 / ACAM 623) TaxID=313595 RepID=K4IHA4_PSYTT|nr:hypothetical protein P700755_003262 [Psychroflexus torquis ATCC 700755]
MRRSIIYKLAIGFSKQGSKINVFLHLKIPSLWKLISK